MWQDTLISVNYNTHGYDLAKEVTPVPPSLISDLEGLLQSLESMEDEAPVVDDFSFALSIYSKEHQLYSSSSFQDGHHPSDSLARRIYRMIYTLVVDHQLHRNLQRLSREESEYFYQLFSGTAP